MAEKPLYSKSPELEACFQTLPKYVQEGIMQSGVQFANPEELKQFARHLMETDHNL